jgi:ABC-2 type transport system ATP-binding protein
MKNMIEVESLKKRYGDNDVLKGISFEVTQGEIFALLGTNGAGKTTTLECIEGIRKYQSGSIRVTGKTGVQLQSSSLPEHMRAREAIKLFAKWNRAKVDNSFNERLGLDEIKNKAYKDMSAGQKRRLHLALAMTGDPDIVFLDEPTAGLDVEGRAALHDEIRALKTRGKTVVLASHDMAEVESLCDRIAILKDGLIAFIGTANELTAQICDTFKVLIRLSAPVTYNALKHCVFTGTHQGYDVFETDSLEDGLAELLAAAKANDVHVRDLKLERANLEQRFLDIAKEGKQ